VNEIIFVLGGCRSGKSAYALQAAEQMPGSRKFFIATCVPQDEEMKQRVARHQKERNQHWTTVEEPLHLPETILENSPQADVILIDCLTLWVSNVMMNTNEDALFKDHIFRLTDAMKEADCPLIVVSNEVGTGIVPENPLARQFRDITGWANQAVAACADQVVWMVAGIPVKVKG
jgi:adenosylcobinamide kinase/adenosylcobinamide-phosphate guanylyltransferase